jgi:PAS domain-containing protein
LPIRKPAGRVIWLAGAVSDVTTSKEMERALHASEERHALAMEAMNETVYEWYIDMGEMYYSPRLHQTLGLTPEHLRPRIH